MTQLLNGEPQENCSPGNYIYSFTNTVGTTELVYTIKGMDPITVPDSLFTNVSGGVTVKLPQCTIEAVITGDGKVDLTAVPNIQ